MREMLDAWCDAGPQLEALVDASPALAEGRQLAADLSQVGTTGSEALAYLTKNVAPGDEWRASRLAALDETAKQKAAVEIVVVQSVRQLVIAAAELPALKQTTPADWKARVKALAAPPAKQPGQ
jgi:hypothetical protein